MSSETYFVFLKNNDANIIVYKNLSWNVERTKLTTFLVHCTPSRLDKIVNEMRFIGRDSKKGTTSKYSPTCLNRTPR